MLMIFKKYIRNRNMHPNQAMIHTTKWIVDQSVSKSLKYLEPLISVLYPAASENESSSKN